VDGWVARMKQIDLLYRELTFSVLKDIENLILRAGGNFYDAAVKSDINPKIFYRYLAGNCSFSTALITHKKICEALLRGETFKRRRNHKSMIPGLPSKAERQRQEKQFKELNKNLQENENG
jgi:hypothetical protein